MMRKSCPETRDCTSQKLSKGKRPAACQLVSGSGEPSLDEECFAALGDLTNADEQHVLVTNPLVPNPIAIPAEMAALLAPAPADGSESDKIGKSNRQTESSEELEAAPAASRRRRATGKRKRPAGAGAGKRKRVRRNASELAAPGGRRPGKRKRVLR